MSGLMPVVSGTIVLRRENLEYRPFLPGVGHT
jgi:hypothetical protein